MPGTELLRKPLLKLGGFYHAPQERFDATNIKRAERWVKKFREMKAEGFKFPVPWGHHLSAVPCEPGQMATDQERDNYRRAIERRNFETSRYNATYIEDVDIDHTPEGDFFVVCVPPPPGYKYSPSTNSLINESDGTSIAEVSGAWGNYKDGQGRTHKDILIHAALCTYPVWSGQKGFELSNPSAPTTLSGLGNVEFTFTLSSAGSIKMAKNKSNDDMPMDDEEDLAYMDDADDSGDDMDDADDESGTASPAVGDVPEEVPEEDASLDTPPVDTMVQPDGAVDEVAAPIPMAGAGTASGPDKAKEVVRMFGEMGLALPPQTDASNLLDHLYIALMVAQNMGAKFEKNEPDDAAAAAAAPATAMTGQEAPPTAEPAPTMMSGPTQVLFEQLDPRLQKAYAKQHRQMKKEYAEICEEIKGLGCPVFKADEYASRVSTVTLSLTKTGEPKLPVRLMGLRMVRDVLRAMKHGPKKSKRTTTLSAHPKTTRPTNPVEIAARIRDSKGTLDAEGMNWLRAGASSGSGANLNGSAKH